MATVLTWESRSASVGSLHFVVVRLMERCALGLGVLSSLAIERPSYALLEVGA